MRPVGTRAAPMPPGERRAAIVQAALPLLRLHGESVTTRQIADAAGVAEGTIFRVFDDKESLIMAVIDEVFDPLPTIAQLRAIDRSLPLRARLIDAVTIIAHRLDSVWELMSALRMMGAPEQNPRIAAELPPHQLHDLMPAALMELIEPDRAAFRVDPAQAARVLRQVTFACTHPRITNADPMSSPEIVDLLLDGLRSHSPPRPPAAGP